MSNPSFYVTLVTQMDLDLVNPIIIISAGVIFVFCYFV